MKLFLSILFFILFIFIFSKIDYKDIEESNDPGYNQLLKWGLNHSLNITNKIKFVKEKDTKKYIAKNLIPEEDIIMDIPPECMISVNKSLDLLNSKKFRKAYDTYKKEDKENKNVVVDEQGVDQAFLAYILYVVNHSKKSFEKKNNKFYEYYKDMSYSFEDNLDSLPFYYSSQQMRFFLNTSFGSIFEIINRFVNDEAILFEKKIYKKPFILEEYLPYRVFTVQKGHDVGGVQSLVPFLDYFKKDFKNINCESKVENGHIIVKAIHNIFPGEELVMKPETVSNQHRFIFYGETFDENIDIFQTYSIPTVIIQFVTDQKIEFDFNNIGEKSRVDLVQKEFYKNVIDVYKMLARMMKVDDSDENAYKLFLKYISRIRSNFDYIKNEDIRNAFYKKKDIDNVQRIVKGEKMFLDKKINDLKTYIKDLKNKNKKKEEEDNKTEEVNDL
jgi:hypothetical protein